MGRAITLDEVRRVSVPDAAKTLGVSENTIRNYIARGELEASRIGRRVVIRLIDLERFASRNPWRGQRS